MTKTTNTILKKSAAITLSDMEIFVFPELIYSLILANIMSPVIWKWRNKKWFDGIEKKSPLNRIIRLKQYIMENYTFNLDLETWGLTTQEKEMERFTSFIDKDILKQSNALFGYEGDKYYFDIDIRTHFGLDKYSKNIIPYWKTETVEAMDAFRNKADYTMGAGECVSLSALYAAALFIVARIPLKNIFLIATPLHSQNFVISPSPILTNNRRILTKNMWFNGTIISTKSRRALENEKVTIVSHESGYIHTIYKDATISLNDYSFFRKNLKNFLQIKLTSKILGNFLRKSRNMQECIQVKWDFHGNSHYIGLERLFDYELRTPYMITDDTRKLLMNKIDPEEFHTSLMPNRIILNELEDYINKNSIDFSNYNDIKFLKSQLTIDCLKTSEFIINLKNFCITSPALPDEKKKIFSSTKSLGIIVDMSRNEIIKQLEDISIQNETARLAFYSFRDFHRTDPLPFLLAALERNPVSINAFINKDIDEITNEIDNFKNESIYSEDYRLAQPDEVFNFQAGDGIEKALLLANILKNSKKTDLSCLISIEILNGKVFLRYGKSENLLKFATKKQMKNQLWKINEISCKII